MKKEFIQGWQDAAALFEGRTDSEGNNQVKDNTDQHLRMSYLILFESEQGPVAESAVYSAFHRKWVQIPSVIGNCMVEDINDQITGVFSEPGGSGDNELSGYIIFSHRFFAERVVRLIAAKIETYFQFQFTDDSLGEVIVYAELELAQCNGQPDKPTSVVRREVLYNEGFDGVSNNDVIVISGNVA